MDETVLSHMFINLKNSAVEVLVDEAVKRSATPTLFTVMVSGAFLPPSTLISMAACPTVGASSDVIAKKHGIVKWRFNEFSILMIVLAEWCSVA